MQEVARASCAQSKPIPIRDQRQLEVGWARLARAMRLAPAMSGDFSRSNARGRSDLHSSNDGWTSQAHGRPGIPQDRRGMNAASSPFRQNGDSHLAETGRSGFRKQIDGLGWPRAHLCIDTSSRSARRGACSAGRVTGRPRNSAWRAKVGFGGECGGSRAARADGAVVWAWDRRGRAAGLYGARFEGSHHALGTADAAKWVKRREYCLKQPRATISMDITTGLRRRPTVFAAERRRGPLPRWKRRSPEGGTGRASYCFTLPTSFSLSFFLKGGTAEED